MKIALGLPCSFPMVYEDFMASVVLLDKTGFEVELFRSRVGHDIALLRNNLVKSFLESDCTHLLQIDSDMIFSSNALLNLALRNVDIVGALYFMRYPPFSPCAVKFEGDTIHEFTVSELETKELIEVSRIGTGLILVRREVFENVKYPWFLTRKKNGQVVMSDDYYFCDKAREVGYKIYLDTSVPCQHVTTAAIDIAWYAKFYHQYAERDKSKIVKKEN